MQPPPIGRALNSRSPRATSTPSAMIFSDTACKVLLLDVLQQPLRSPLYKIQDVLEALRTTVEGIWDLGLRAVGSVVEKGAHHGTPPSAKSRNRPVVLLVHRQNVVEALAVIRSDPAGPLSAYDQAPGARAPLRPLVRRMSDVPGSSSGGVYEDLAFEPLASHELFEDALSKWGTAYLTHTA